MVKIKNVYQDKDSKRWFFRAYLGTDASGKKIQKTKRGFESQREAKRAYDRYMLTHGFQQTFIQKSSSLNHLTFEEFYRLRFLNWYKKQVKTQTYENAQFIFEKKMRYFYHMKVRDINNHDIEDWVNELSQTVTRNSRKREEGTTLSKTYINRILGHLKIVMARAVNEGIIDQNPVEKVGFFRKDNYKVEFWEVEEFQRVMDVIQDSTVQNQHRKIAYELLFYTGLRIGEFQALTWDNVDLVKNQLTVEKTLIYKGKRDWYFSTPKTNKSYRTIGIGKVLSEKLKKWKDLQNRIGNFEYVSQLDGTFTPSYSYSTWLKDYARTAGVAPIKLHALRHSHVAMLIDKNIQPLVIQERLGHANIQITLGTYGHLYAKSDKQVVEVLDNII